MKVLSLRRRLGSQIIEEAVETLKKGGLIIYPTETCYGLGADATNAKAVDKLLIFKGERRKKPISVAVADKKMARKYVKINPTAENIYRHFLPGPITVVSQSRQKVDPHLESKDKTLGVRIPDYPLVLEIIKKFGRPLTATSANISGGKTPYSIPDILNQLTKKKKKLIALVIDGGKLPSRPPSSVVDTTLNEPALLRQGEINFEKLGAKSVISHSPQETKKFAKGILERNLSFLKKKALFFALQGELGAGKTQFAKGLGQGLKINRPITSPTFVIVKEYPYCLGQNKGVFYHLDAWRLRKTSGGLEFIKNYLQPGNVIALEWVQKGKKTLERLTKNQRVKIIWIEIKHLDQTSRQIKFTR